VTADRITTADRSTADRSTADRNTADRNTADRNTAADQIADTWNRFWFTPVDPRPLAAVRVLTALLGLTLLWSYAADLQTWFGPAGMLPVETVAGLRPPAGWSLYDLATTSTAVWAVFAATAVAFVVMGAGLVPRLSTAVAAVLWASLLNRGPVLAGPADDCLAVLLWCLVAAAFSPALGRGLLQVHAAAIAAAAAVAQLKGDVWWDGTAAWWLAAREESRLVDLTGLFRASEYLMNLVTHAVPVFEILFAIGLWFTATQPLVARAGLVAWPLIGVLAGQPAWGVALAIVCVPFAWPRVSDRATL
jgi:hypothetical protein